jgi:endonuclease YncB( thermonuclease family)
LSVFISHRKFTASIFAVALLFFSATAGAHPGGQDASGCHTNRSTGDFHCHRQGGGSSSDQYAYQEEIAGKVVAVTDGDTIKVLDASQEVHKIRLNGIDAPEKSQPFGNTSRKYLESLVAGKQVVVKSTKYDRYGRILGNVWVQPADCSRCGKTLYVNYAQVLAGMAWWYRYYADDQTEEDRGRFESAEREAIARKWGLWADPDPQPPWVWRRR